MEEVFGCDLQIHATYVEKGFTNKRVRDIRRTYS